MQKAIVYADGSSIGNPGPGGWGVILAMEDNITELGGGDGQTTNNRMELTGAIQALSHLPEGSEVEIRTDSKYVIDGINKWVHGWEKNGWKTTGKQGVLNRDLWESLIALSRARNVEFTYVEAHAGIPGNERVDEIAQSFGRGEKIRLYKGPKSEYSVNLEVKTASKPFYVSFVDGIFSRHATWEECKVVTSEISGAKYRKVRSEAEAQALEEEWTGHDH